MTENDWWGYFAHGLPDNMTLMAFADWLEERGSPKAPEVRWLLEHRLSPVFCPSHTTLQGEKCPSYDWWRTHGPISSKHCIPSDLFDALPAPREAGPRWDKVHNFREYPSVRDAFEAVIMALISIGATTDVCPSCGSDQAP